MIGIAGEQLAHTFSSHTHTQHASHISPKLVKQSFIYNAYEIFQSFQSSCFSCILQNLIALVCFRRTNLSIFAFTSAAEMSLGEKRRTN